MGEQTVRAFVKAGYCICESYPIRPLIGLWPLIIRNTGHSSRLGI